MSFMCDLGVFQSVFICGDNGLNLSSCALYGRNPSRLWWRILCSSPNVVRRAVSKLCEQFVNGTSWGHWSEVGNYCGVILL